MLALACRGDGRGPERDPFEHSTVLWDNTLLAEDGQTYELTEADAIVKPARMANALFRTEARAF